MVSVQERNRRAGAEWETRIVKILRQLGHAAERLHLNGREDEGDIVVWIGDCGPIVVEAKSGQPHLPQFMRETVAEARNYEKHRGHGEHSATGVCVIKRKNMPWTEAYVVSTLGELLHATQRKQ